MQTKPSMETIKPFFEQAQTGDPKAYGIIIQRFQGMAISYAYSILNDYQLAEDAVQEAFLEAYPKLSKVYGPNAFPSWLRRIIFKHCDRLTRRTRIKTVDLAAASRIPSVEKGPTDRVEEAALINLVRDAIVTLPEHERIVTLLFYQAQLSQKEIAEFLDVQVSTVKNRLHQAQNRLRARLLETREDLFLIQNPSDTEEFAMSIVEIIRAAEQGDLSKLSTLLERHPDLAKAKDERPGATALHYAAWSGHKAAIEILLKYGADINLLDDTNQAPPIGWAGENGQSECLDFLRAKEAKLTVSQAAAYGTLDLVRSMIEQAPSLVNFGEDDEPYDWSPLWSAAAWRRVDIFDYLLYQGANVNAKTRRGERPLHGAAAGGDLRITARLLELGADVNVRTNKGYTPLHIVAWHRHLDLAEFLLEQGADANAVDQEGHTPLSLAIASHEVVGWDPICWGYASPPDAAMIRLLQEFSSKPEA